MSKMTVIQLLNKIANGEEVPREFTYKGYLWEYDVKNKMWFYYFGESKSHRFDRLFYLNMILNDEVEIIEPQEHKIPEKLKCKAKFQYSEIPTWLEKKEIINAMNENFEKHQKAIYEILDYLEEIK